MSVSFQEINPVEINAQWSQQPFHGFSLDSRKVQSGQIFIALTSYSQPENTCFCRVGFSQWRTCDH